MKIVVMSVGGSIVVPDEVDYKFIRDFKKVISKVKAKVVVVVGGGKTVYANLD